MIKAGDMVRPKTRYSSSLEMALAYESKSISYFSLLFQEYSGLLDSGEWFRVFDISEKGDSDTLCLQVVLPSKRGYFGDISYCLLASDMEKYISPKTEII